MGFATDINFLPFFIAGVLAFILNVVWYHPKILGGRWIQIRTGGRGRRAGDSLPWTGTRNSPLHYMAALFLWTLTACFYSFLCLFLEVNTPVGFLSISCLLWVAFALPPVLMNSLNTAYPFGAAAIDAGCQLAGYLIFACVHIAFFMSLQA